MKISQRSSNLLNIMIRPHNLSKIMKTAKTLQCFTPTIFFYTTGSKFYTCIHHFGICGNLCNGAIIEFNIKEKLHFTTLNYAPYYMLHLKLFECIVCTLNYDSYYTLYLDVSFTIKFDKNMKHVTYMCILLKWHKLKWQKTLSSQSIKK